MRYITALTIAGSDSCGGAGIQADIKTMSALGVYAASAITAVTAQNTLGVTGIEAVSPSMVAAQIRAVMTDLKPLAVKIGMVYDSATTRAIAATLSQFNVKHIVIDPVMVATSGSRLMTADATEAFSKSLLPMATVLTPNIPEAEALSGVRIHNARDCDRAGRILSKSCPGYVLIKGGHADEGEVKRDRLYHNGIAALTVESEAIETTNTHGTGCTLSSAIAALLARGLDVEEAVKAAKKYVSEAIRAGAFIQAGSGHGPVNHFFDPQKLITT